MNDLLASKEIRDLRGQICSSCEHVKKIAVPNFPAKTLFCGICKCSIGIKIYFAGSKCPDKPPRWEAIDIS